MTEPLHEFLPPVEWGRGNLPAPVVENSTEMGQRDLFIYWSYVRARPVPLTQAGLMQKRVLRNINEQLLSPDSALATASCESDAPRLYFLRLLLQKLGLLTTEHGRLQVTGQRNQVPEFWRRTVAERTQTCLKAWQNLKEWSELASLSLPAFSFDLPQARGVLLDQLCLLSPELWASAERFLNRLATIAPRLLFLGRELPVRNSTYPVDPGYPETDHTTRQSRWLSEVEAAFVGGALSGPLHWLGLLDICVDEGRLLAFRLNPSGAHALHPELAPAEDSSEARLVIQPNFQILALGPLPEAILAHLEAFAERVKADRSTVEYQLSRETVYRAQQDGLSVAEIVAFLQQAGSAPLPQNVLRTLQEWGEQHERIVFHRAVTLCQAASPGLEDRLWADPTLQKHWERRLTPSVMLVKPGHVATLRGALLQKDILPASFSKDDCCAGRVQATPQGELRPIREGSDLLLEARLRELAEEQAGRFYITETAVSNALAMGMSIPEYLQQLATLHRGPLPAALQSRIKAWGHYYGKASLQKATLLEVRDAAIADELLADKELSTLLSRFPAEPRGKLLLVRTRELERLRRLLRKRGVELA